MAYSVIQDWMSGVLGLSGNELLVFAVVYGFSQDEESCYVGGLKFLSKFLRITKENARLNLKKLCEKNYLVKREQVTGGVKFCHYTINFETIQSMGVALNQCGGGIESMPNNKYRDNKEMSISISKDMSILPKKSDIDRIVSEWNSLGLTQVMDIKPHTQRYNSLNARISDYGEGKVIEAIRKIGNSSFLKGSNDRGWQITFDWFVQKSNFIKVLEGNYDDRDAVPKSDPFMDELAKLYEEGLD